MRGIGKYMSVKTVSGRITPAYAGNSEYQKETGNLYKDHPRICGNSENQSEEVIDNEDHPRICGE